MCAVVRCLLCVNCCSLLFVVLRVGWCVLLHAAKGSLCVGCCLLSGVCWRLFVVVRWLLLSVVRSV